MYFEICHCCKKTRLPSTNRTTLNSLFICKECEKNSLASSLSPREWYNLITIYGPDETAFNDHRYYDDGEAIIPQIQRVFSDIDKLPNLDSVKNNLNDLLEFCFFPFANAEDAEKKYQRLSKFASKEILSRVETLMNQYPTPYVWKRAYSIVKKVIAKNEVVDWIRSQWKVNAVAAYQKKLREPYETSILMHLLALSVLHISAQEIFKLADNLLSIHSDAILLFFKFPELRETVLEWLETNPDKITRPYMDWGAKIADKTITWFMIEKWLDRGRPYSVIALGTLMTLITQYQLYHPASIEHMTQVLSNYSVRDPAPNIKNVIQKINSSWAEISNVKNEKHSSKIINDGTIDDCGGEGYYRTRSMGLRVLKKAKNIISYCITTFFLIESNDAASNDTTKVITKFGGQPDWLLQPEWPLSQFSGKPLSFLGQLIIDKKLFPNVSATIAYLFCEYAVDPDGEHGENYGQGIVILQPNHNENTAISGLQQGATVSTLSYGIQTTLFQDINYIPNNYRHTLEKYLSDEQRTQYNNILNAPFNKIGGVPSFIQSQEYPEREKEWNLLLQLDMTTMPFNVNTFDDCSCKYIFISASGKLAKMIVQWD